jgi:hypothetical protein
VPAATTEASRMSVAFLALALAISGLVGMVSSGPNTPVRDQDPDVVSGEAKFGKFVEVLTLIGIVLLALIVLGGIMSYFGVFEKEIIDPPV